jgi:uncharacterized membrane protein YphA (DoxX/SURF4 family)
MQIVLSSPAQVKAVETAAVLPPLQFKPRSRYATYLVGLGAALAVVGVASPDILGVVARAVVGGFFVWAATAKLVDLAGFARQVRRFPLAVRVASTPSAARRLALAVCLLELVLAIGLLTGYAGAVFASLLVALLLVFSLAIVMAIRSGTAAPCGCLGNASSRAPVGRAELWRNGALAALVMCIPATTPATNVTLWPTAIGVAAVSAVFAVRARARRRSILVHAPRSRGQVQGRVPSRLARVLRRLSGRGRNCRRAQAARWSRGS